MGCRVNRLPFFILHHFKSLMKKFSLGLKDFDFLPQPHLVALLHRRKTRLLVIGKDKPDEF